MTHATAPTCACCKHKTAATACDLRLVQVHWLDEPVAPPADEFALAGEPRSGRLVRACKGCGLVCRLRTWEPATPEAEALADGVDRWPGAAWGAWPAEAVAGPAPQLALL